MCLTEKFRPYFLSLIHFFDQILDYKRNISDIARANCNCKRVFFSYSLSDGLILLQYFQLLLHPHSW